VTTTETTFEHVALEKQLCAACGGEGEWDPSKQALVCVFCGTVSPVEVDPESGTVREIDLVRALREMPEDDRGWESERRSVRCQSCNAVSVFEPGQIGKSCDFCGATQLVDYGELKAPIRPESLLPFRIDDETAHRQARTWLRGRWFAPGSLKKKALDALRGVYLPYWTFDAQAFCPWTAESGTYYYTTQVVRDSKGKTSTRQVRHTRWKPVRGVIEQFFDDLPVPGTRGVDRSLLARVGPFPTHELMPYESEYLAGYLVEHYQVVLFDAFEEAKERMGGELHKLCAREIPGDTHRNLAIQPEFSRQTFKHILLPAWLASFRFRKKVYQVLINGCTGEVAGFYPKSWWKIVLAVLGAGAAVALVVLLLNS
jgi:hypothetical protein